MNWNRATLVPSLHHRKEGWLRHQKISRSHRNGRSRGGFPFVSIGKPPRLRSQRMLRNIFLIAQPPLAVMQGDDYAARFQFVHTFYDRRYSTPETRISSKDPLCGVFKIDRAGFAVTASLKNRSRKSMSQSQKPRTRIESKTRSVVSNRAGSSGRKVWLKRRSGACLARYRT